MNDVATSFLSRGTPFQKNMNKNLIIYLLLQSEIAGLLILINPHALYADILALIIVGWISYLVCVARR